VAKQKEVKIVWEGNEEVVVMKRLSFGELNQLTEEATEVRFVNAQPMIKVSQKVMKESGILKSLVKAPFPICLASIQNLEQEAGLLLFNTFTELNEVDEKKSSE
jgi:hypothetical protein